LRHLGAPQTSRAPRDTFPILRAAARRARALGRRLAAASVVALLTLLLATAVMNEIAGRALERELAAVRAQGQPLTLREAAPPGVPDAESAALVYAEACQQLSRVEAPSLSKWHTRLGTEQEQALRDYLAAKAGTARADSASKVHALLAETAPALERARVAA